MGGDDTIADMANFPWVNHLVGFHGAGPLAGCERFTQVQRVLAAFLARPAVARRLQIPPRP